MNRGFLIALVAAGAVTILGSVLVAIAFWGGENVVGSAVGYAEVEGTITDSRETVRQLRQLDDNPSVKGILLRVNSPGGVVTPAHEIYSELKRIRDSGKPIVVSMGTVAASGGYYISTPATTIVANPGTLTGSIGVIMELPVVRGLMNKVGVKVEVVKSADNKDIGSPFRDMKDSDRRLLQNVVSDVYEQFIEVVSVERGIPPDSLRPIADGRILTGRQALACGLVDTLGTMADARQIAASLCGIKGEPRLIRVRPGLGTLIRRMMDGASERLFGVISSPRLSYRWY